MFADNNINPIVAFVSIGAFAYGLLFTVGFGIQKVIKLRIKKPAVALIIVTLFIVFICVPPFNLYLAMSLLSLSPVLTIILHGILSYFFYKKAILNKSVIYVALCCLSIALLISTILFAYQSRSLTIRFTM